MTNQYLSVSQLLEIAQQVGYADPVTLEDIMNPKWHKLLHGSWADYLCADLKKQWDQLPVETRLGARRRDQHM